LSQRASETAEAKAVIERAAADLHMPRHPKPAKGERVTIDVGDDERVSGLLRIPDQPRACYVMAHGAGAGMTHPFLAAMADGLAERGIATLRYQFPYMERGSKRPDSPTVAQRVVRATVGHAARALPGVVLIAGGKSFGGRMTSQAQAESPLPNVRGLAFLGFPLHAAGKPSIARAEHLASVHVPMLFLQGTRDALADASLMQQVVTHLGKPASVQFIDNADHSFHVPASSGRTDAQIADDLQEAIARWIGRIA
jgi:predicted alpha/beta-hydrolase family hydrolase